MKVIQTFVELIKRNTADKQIVLVNMAQALKYLEAYGQRQSQLFTVLENNKCCLEIHNSSYSTVEFTFGNEIGYFDA